MYKPERELGRQDLRELFNVTEAEWLLYKRADGSVGIQAPTMRGKSNVDRAVAAGAIRLPDAKGVSRKEAIKAAKTK